MARIPLVRHCSSAGFTRKASHVLAAVGRAGRGPRPLSGHTIAPLRRIAMTAILTLTSGCAATSSVVRVRSTLVPSPSVTCPVFVMWPTTAPAAFQGNVGGGASDIESTVANRILEVVREQCPDGAIWRAPLATPFAATPALDRTGVTAGEQSPATSANAHGARYLLLPTIQHWQQRRTDDPIGALLPPHNSVSVSVRLMRVQPPAVLGSVTFMNRSRITLNQAAARLLNDRFRDALRDLLGSRRTSCPGAAPGASCGRSSP
jgi:hypothetical protein